MELLPDRGGLLRYLYGPGKANEHIDPHLVAGFYDPAYLEARYPDGWPDTRRLSTRYGPPSTMPQPLAGPPVTCAR